jgi:hypothetical protein
MNAMNTLRETNTMPGLPWWKTPAMWLVVGLPAVVVVAGFITLWIALARPDAVVDPDYYRKGISLGQPQGEAAAARKAHVPAQTGRNHAMTPDKDLPASKD